MKKVYEFVLFNEIEECDCYFDEFSSVKKYIKEKGECVWYIKDCMSDDDCMSDYNVFINKKNKLIEELDEYGGRNEKENITKYIEMIENVLKKNSDYVCIEFSVEYDWSFIVMNKNDIDKILEYDEDEY